MPAVSRLQIRRKINKKILFKGNAQAKEQVSVDTCTFENVVDIAPVAVNLAAEPTDGTLLAAELLLNYFSNMYGFKFLGYPAFSCHINCIFTLTHVMASSVQSHAGKINIANGMQSICFI